MGYGSRAIEMLNSYYSGELFNIDDVPDDLGESFEEFAKVDAVSTLLIPALRLQLIAMQGSSLQSDAIAVRSADRMPPLLQRLSEKRPESLDYLGVSFGLTKELLRFWKRSGFVPLYASQKENSLTGEYTFVMLRTLLSNIAQADGWLSSFALGESSCAHQWNTRIRGLTHV